GAEKSRPDDSSLAGKLRDEWCVRRSGKHEGRLRRHRHQSREMGECLLALPLRRTRRESIGDDADIAADDTRGVAGATKLRSEPLDCAGLLNVESLASGRLTGLVDEPHVCGRLAPRQCMRDRAAEVTG